MRMLFVLGVLLIAQSFDKKLYSQNKITLLTYHQSTADTSWKANLFYSESDGQAIYYAEMIQNEESPSNLEFVEVDPTEEDLSEGIYRSFEFSDIINPFPIKDDPYPSIIVESDLQNKTMLSIAKFTGLGKIYFVSEDIGKIKWKIKKERRVISGYNCQKATGKFGGRTYTVWFTPDLPISAGPWKLHGLPGAVVVSEEGYFKFSLQKVTYNSTPSPYKIEVPADTKTISCEELLFLKEEDNKAINKKLMAKLPRGVDVEIETESDLIQRKCN